MFAEGWRVRRRVKTEYGAPPRSQPRAELANFFFWIALAFAIMAKEYDLLLCGVTGFTGKLAAEHLLAKGYPIKWAVCARNEAKAKSCLAALGAQLGKSQQPPVEVADLVCTTAEEEARLRSVVQKTKVPTSLAHALSTARLRAAAATRPNRW